ncbi:hypothetical protein DFH06DRAFT_1320716 [Mycena polygramma]|nr:hypothetical protein DFH06DRAFT_1320716 [Mycena polygramma]
MSTNGPRTAAQEARRQLVSGWSPEELLRWDEQRRAYAAARPAPAPASTSVVPDVPDGDEDHEDEMPGVNDALPVVYNEVLDTLLPVIMLPPSHVRAEAGIRGASARAHARQEAERAHLQRQARLQELTRASARTEFARVALARCISVTEIVAAQATLRARERVEEILRTHLRATAALVPAEEVLALSDEEWDEGWRAPRAERLKVDELYIGTQRPAEVTTEERVHQMCAVCRQVKSNPVSYRCGHSHCYVCIRMWLEHSWKCPECITVMQESPVRHFPEENGIAFDFPSRANETKVTYSWDGLSFPQRTKGGPDSDSV